MKSFNFKMTKIKKEIEIIKMKQIICLKLMQLKSLASIIQMK